MGQEVGNLGVFPLLLVITVARAWMETTGTGASAPLVLPGLTAE